MKAMSRKRPLKVREDAPALRACALRSATVTETARPRGDQLLARLGAEQHARLRIYIGAAPGVGKTYSMIEDAHALRGEGIDVVIGFIEAHGRADTEARIGDLEVIPRRRL